MSSNSTPSPSPTPTSAPASSVPVCSSFRPSCSSSEPSNGLCVCGLPALSHAAAADTTKQEKDNETNEQRSSPALLDVDASISDSPCPSPSPLTDCVPSSTEALAAPSPSLPPRPVRPKKPIGLTDTLLSTPTPASAPAATAIPAASLSSSVRPRLLPATAPCSLAASAFADRLYHKADIVVGQGEAGMKASKRLHSFFQSFSKIQERAAMEVQKAATQELSKLQAMKPADRMNSGYQVTKGFLEKFSRLSYAHQNLSIETSSSCVEPLGEFIAVGQATAAQCEEEARKIAALTDSLKIQVNKERESLKQLLATYGEKKDALRLNEGAAVGLFSKNTQERQKEVDKLRDKCIASCGHYEQTVINANIQHQKNQYELPRVLTDLQALEEMRLTALFNGVNQFTRILANYEDAVQAMGQELQQLASGITVDGDFNSFIDGVNREFGPANNSAKNPFTYDINVKTEDLRNEQQQQNNINAMNSSNNSSAAAAPAVSPLFGLSLDEVVKGDRKAAGAVANFPVYDVPRLVPALLCAIEDAGGLTSEGIFRISASVDDLQSVRKALERGDYRVNASSPHIPAGVLKSWLRELSEPLVPQEFYARCIDIGRLLTPDLSDSQQRDLATLVSAFPLLNRRVMFVLIQFLNKLGLPVHQQQTRMSLNNLGIVFGPSFLRNASNDPNTILQESKYSAQFVYYLMTYEAVCFPDEAEWGRTQASGCSYREDMKNVVEPVNTSPSIAVAGAVNSLGIPNSNNPGSAAGSKRGSLSGPTDATPVGSPLASLTSLATSVSSPLSSPASSPAPAPAPISLPASSPLATAAASGASAAALGAVKSLIAPQPWKEVSDHSTGLIYYYNEQTRETKWSKPAGFKSNH